MTWVDIVVIAVIVLSGLLALARGFVREVLGVAAWIGAGLAALELYPDVEPELAGLIHQPKLILPVSIGLVFIVVLIVLSIISAWLGSMVRDSALSGLDRTLGLVFGLVRGAVIVCLLYVGLWIFLQPTEWPAGITNARTLPYARNGAVWLDGFLPAAYRPNLEKHAGAGPLPAPAMPSVTPPPAPPAAQPGNGSSQGGTGPASSTDAPGDTK